MSAERQDPVTGVLVLVPNTSGKPYPSVTRADITASLTSPLLLGQLFVMSTEKRMYPFRAREDVEFLILAGGIGSRYNATETVLTGQEETFKNAKLTVRLNGKSLPQHALEFAVHNGARRVHVTLGHGSASKQIEADLEFSAAMNAVALVTRTQDPTTYGTGAALLPWQEYTTAPLIVLFGDNFYQGDLPQFPDLDTLYFTYSTALDLQASFAQHPANVMYKRYAAVLDDRIIEKPHNIVDGPFFTGLLRLPYGFLYEFAPNSLTYDTFFDTLISPRGEMEITESANAWPKRAAIPLTETSMLWGDLTYRMDVEHLQTLITSSSS